MIDDGILENANAEPDLSFYVLLAAAGPERLEALTKTIRTEVLPEERVIVVVAEDEWESLQADLASERLVESVEKWRLLPTGRIEVSGVASAANEITVFLSHGVKSPVDFLEGLERWSRESGQVVGRITTLVDCSRCAEDTDARHWYDACIHFSDLVWLGNREELDPKWIKNYEEGFKKRAFPCLFDLVKKGQPKNPNWFFDEQDRRMSLLFDEIEEDPEDEEMPEAPVDPYLDRNLGGGRKREVGDL